MSIQPNYGHIQIVKKADNTDSVKKCNPQAQQTQMHIQKLNSQTTKIYTPESSPNVLTKIVPKLYTTVQKLGGTPQNTFGNKLRIENNRSGLNVFINNQYNFNYIEQDNSNKIELEMTNSNKIILQLETLLDRYVSNNSNHAKTVECCEGILKIDPHNIKAHTVLVKSYYQNAAYDMALSWGEKLLDICKNSEITSKSANIDEIIQYTKIIFGKIYYKGNSTIEKNYKMSHQYLVESLDHGPDNKIALSMLTNIFMLGGHGIEMDDSKATRYALELHKNYPNDTNALFYLAQVFAYGGKGIDINYKTTVEFALKLLKENELQKQSSNHEETLAILIQTHFLGGNGIDKDYKAALKYSIRLIEINPKHHLAFKTLIEIYRVGGHGIEKNTDMAIRMLDAYINLISDTFSDEIDVVDRCGDILTRNLNSTELLEDLAKAYYSGTSRFSKDYKKAEKYYKILTKIDPTHIQALLALSKMYLTGELGLEINYKEAERVTDVLLDIDSINDDALMKTLFLRSKIYFEGGYGINKDHSKASYICQRILSDFGSRRDRKAHFANAWANYVLGRIYFEGSDEIPKNDDKALKHLENLCETKDKKLLYSLPNEDREWAKKTLYKIQYNK